VAEIQIVRDHALGFAQARKLAYRWAEVAEQKLDMECTYAEGKTSDTVTFTRPGAKGELTVTKDRFALEAKLGLLLGVFKGKIESEIVKNLDQLLKEKDPLHAFDSGIARHDAKHSAKHEAKHHAAKKAPVKAPAKAAAKAPAAKKAK
jgi:putative polyhydroxyalkanoate system protein